eukprot:14965183-Ditylum_brightwellii.AAC.1
MLDTSRRLHAAFDNIYMSSAEAHLQGIHFCRDRGANYHAVPHPTHSPLFELFMCGLLKQMGRDVCPDMALDYRILHTILSNIEKDLLEGPMNRKQK